MISLTAPIPVIPAKAGIHLGLERPEELDPRFRGDDGTVVPSIGRAATQESGPMDDNLLKEPTAVMP
jgi:hypothetical protein